MATHTRVRYNANRGSHGNHLSTALPHLSTSSASAQANLFLVPDPATWVMSLESLTDSDFFHALVGVMLTFQFPVLTLAIVTSLFWSTNTWDYVVLAVASIVQWLLAHLIPLIPGIFWVLLLAAIVFLPHCSWFCDDPYLLTHHELHAYHQAYHLHATKCHHHF